MIARQPGDRPRDAYVIHDALEAVLQRVTGESPAPPSVAPNTEARPPALLPDLGATMVDGPPESVLPSPKSWLADELTARPPAEFAERWHKTLADLEQHVEAAGRARRSDAATKDGVRRARDLSETARSLLASLDRAKSAVVEHQAQVDALEARGRSFRATLGHAIDALSRDRSRELAHLEAIAALRSGIHEEMEAAPATHASARASRGSLRRCRQKRTGRERPPPISTTRSRRSSGSSMPRTETSRPSSRTPPVGSRAGCRR